MSQPVVLFRIIHARLLVGALGECLGWWPSKFTTDAGRRNLQLVLPRSWRRAVLESVTLAARGHHDRVVPTRALHLFRLGTAHEDAIAHHLAGGSVELETPPDSPDAIVSALQDFGATVPADAGPGPLLLGSASRLREHAAVNELAGSYMWAVGARAVTVPYFSEAS